MLSDSMLKVILKKLLPGDILREFSDLSKFDVIFNFVKDAINSSAIFIRGPEKFFRLFLFCLIVILKLLELISIKLITIEGSLRKISKLHPIFDDGMRLYISLAMFAIFEDDKMRVNNGFLPIKDLPKSFKNFE
tara:strand:- start:462 stop:863 length:402 start_codon:yes stop_codon:yes gene_type:complete